MRDLAQRLVGVGGVHLVGLLVALERAAGADRVAERAVEAGGVLGGVAHDEGVGEVVGFQRAADHADAAVHHVGGAEDVAAGLGLDEGHPFQRQQRLVVEDDAVADEAVVAVGIVGVEGDVEEDADLGDGGLDGAGGAADEVLGVPGLGGVGVLVGGLRVGKEREAGDAEAGGLLGGADGAVDREAGDAGERGDGLVEVVALADEDRPDQVGGGEAGLRHHGADPRGAAEAARTALREGGLGGHRAGLPWAGRALKGKCVFTMCAAARVDGGGRDRKVGRWFRARPARPGASGWAVFQIFVASGFQSVWYWVLHVVVWTLACYRTLGVPHDMLLRARRLPEVEGRVDLLAGLAAVRIGGIHDALGVPLAAVAGFVLATVFALGFLSGIETAQAIFVLILPLAVISYSKLRLALAVRRRGMAGPELVLALARRRLVHQFIAIAAMLAAAAIAIALHPPRLAPL